MKMRTVLVTGANGYIGNAVAKAFARAGWVTYGLVRRAEAAGDLARNEIHPIIGTPEDLAFMRQIEGIAFDVLVSNTEDPGDPSGHLSRVRLMLDEIVGRDAGKKRPLVMFSSGCKDYGPMSQKHGDPQLAPHSESSPLNPPDFLASRCEFGSALLDKSRTSYDAIVLRPTIVYGLSSSYYGALFRLAATSESVLTLKADPDAIMHSCHVDDCAEAYVQLAAYPDRASVVNQAFNISNARYETAHGIGEALARSYGLKLSFVEPDDHMCSVYDLANFWQWVGSDKIRNAIGWREKRLSFIDGVEEYRTAYEAHRQFGR